jgi:hypothetical protein
VRFIDGQGDNETDTCWHFSFHLYLIIAVNYHCDTKDLHDYSIKPVKENACCRGGSNAGTKLTGIKKTLTMQIDMLPTSSGYISGEHRGGSSSSDLGRGWHFCLGTDRVLHSAACLWIITGYTDFREISRIGHNI